MSDKWKEIGPTGGVIGGLLSSLDGVTEVLVENESGEQRIVYVGPNETTGEAIAKGDFKTE